MVAATRIYLISSREYDSKTEKRKWTPWNLGSCWHHQRDGEAESGKITTIGTLEHSRIIQLFMSFEWILYFEAICPKKYAAHRPEITTSVAFLWVKNHHRPTGKALLYGK
jgi:hypothetical protein